MNRKLTALIATATIAAGGLSVAGVAAAQSYGSEPEPAEPTAAETPDETGTADTGTLVEIQDTDGTDTDTDEATPEEGEAEAGERDGREHHGRRSHGCGNLEAAADAIGIDVGDLRTALSEGQSIADVAAANGVNTQVVIDAMVQAAADHLAEKVADGELTQEEADERLAHETEEINERIDQVRPEGGPDGADGPRGERGPRGDGPTEETADA